MSKFNSFFYIVFANLALVYQGDNSLCRYSSSDPDIERICGFYAASNTLGWIVFILFIFSTRLAWKVYRAENQFNDAERGTAVNNSLPQQPL